MKYKTLFRLLLKFLGVWLGATALSSLTFSVGSILNTIWIQRPAMDGFAIRMAMTSGLSTLAQFAIAVYLFRGAQWIVDKAIPSNRPYCHECGYDLTGTQGPVCNECGTALQEPRSASTAILSPPPSS